MTELLIAALFILGTILTVLTLFMPYFVFRIHQRAQDQVALLRDNLQAQNNIIKILWDTQQQSK
jgi:hypothetical protein